MTDVYTKAKRSEIMSRVRNRRTKPEEEIASMLRRLQVRYRRNVKALPGQPDFAVPSVKTAVFVNGCFWHGHKNCNRASLPQSNEDFWKNKIATNMRRDTRVAKQLNRQGWDVMTIWQCRLRRPDRVFNRLRTMLSKCRPDKDTGARARSGTADKKNVSG